MFECYLYEYLAVISCRHYWQLGAFNVMLRWPFGIVSSPGSGHHITLIVTWPNDAEQYTCKYYLRKDTKTNPFLTKADRKQYNVITRQIVVWLRWLSDWLNCITRLFTTRRQGTWRTDYYNLMSEYCVIGTFIFNFFCMYFHGRSGQVRVTVGARCRNVSGYFFRSSLEHEYLSIPGGQIAVSCATLSFINY